MFKIKLKKPTTVLLFCNNNKLGTFKKLENMFDKVLVQPQERIGHENPDEISLVIILRQALTNSGYNTVQEWVKTHSIPYIVTKSYSDFLLSFEEGFEFETPEQPKVEAKKDAIIPNYSKDQESNKSPVVNLLSDFEDRLNSLIRDKEKSELEAIKATEESLRLLEENERLQSQVKRNEEYEKLEKLYKELQSKYDAEVRMSESRYNEAFSIRKELLELKEEHQKKIVETGKLLRKVTELEKSVIERDSSVKDEISMFFILDHIMSLNIRLIVANGLSWDTLRRVSRNLKSQLEGVIEHDQKKSYDVRTHKQLLEELKMIMSKIPT